MVRTVKDSLTIANELRPAVLRLARHLRREIHSLGVTGGFILLGRHPRTHRPKLDVPGVLFVSSGMFCIVYGFSNAATHNWHTPSTWGFLVAGVLLLAIFAWWETRAAEPLLPLRIVLDRNRGANFTRLATI